MDFILRILEFFFAIVIISFVINLLNKIGISIGNYKKNFSLKIFLVLVLLGITIRISDFFIEYEYLFNGIVEPIVGIITIYIIMALLNRKGLLDKPNINDFVGALFIVGGITSLITIIII